MVSAEWKKLCACHVSVQSHTTPLKLFKTLYEHENSVFLYESLKSAEVRGRYSFLGGRPLLTVQARKERITLQEGADIKHIKGNVIDVLREMMRNIPQLPNVLPFAGGALGYFAYDAIRYIEQIPDVNPDSLDMPDAVFLFPSEIIVFDHQSETIDILLYSESANHTRFSELKLAVQTSADIEESGRQQPKPVEIKSHINKKTYCEMVEKAKEYILSGDVFQVVLSQRFTFPMPAEPLILFEQLRQANPSPYMYFIKIDEYAILGSSPEILAKCNSGKAFTHPLAGTRHRGKTADEDERLAEELLSDEKEKAEHVMLVDLARSDLGRVCIPGTVKAADLMKIEKYAQVMHIVSSVSGQMACTKDAFDLFKAVFPAGTVSGSPKIRAMEIIDELEHEKRGPYAGAVGYFGWNGDMDMCITIRTVIAKKDTGMIQAGAGIVADSDPEKEYEETLKKAKALFNAVLCNGG